MFQISVATETGVLHHGVQGSQGRGRGAGVTTGNSPEQQPGTG